MSDQMAQIKIAQRIVNELKEGQVVNLGVGIPTLAADYIGAKRIHIHSENGLLGMGPTPSESEIDMDLVNAGKKPVTFTKGSSLFDSPYSFAMIRGGHIDVAVMGALQVDETGEIANWSVPGKPVLGVGGAMDLVVGAKYIIIAMTHQSKDGVPKLVHKLTFPSSGTRKANMVITEKAVFRVMDEKLVLIEKDISISLDELAQMTEARFDVIN